MSPARRSSSSRSGQGGAGRPPRPGGAKRASTQGGAGRTAKAGGPKRTPKPGAASRTPKQPTARKGAPHRSPVTPEAEAMAKAARAGLGGVARRGAAQVKPTPGKPRRPEPDRGQPGPWEPERWEDEGVVREATAAVTRGEQAAEARPARARRPVKLPAEVVAELVHVVGPSRAPRLEQRLDDAQRAFQRERYPEARRMLALLVRDAPAAAAVRELNGLTLYRLGHWKAAAVELEAFRALTGSVEQNPVLADCYRALRRWAKADALWAELKATSPSAELVAEGRIVAAGSLADRGDLTGAIALLEPAATRPRVVREHHLRLWYALADLYDRAGDVSRARSAFQRVRAADPSFADVAERLATFG